MKNNDQEFETKIDLNTPEPDEFDLALQRLVFEGRVTVGEDGVIKLVRN